MFERSAMLFAGPSAGGVTTAPAHASRRALLQRWRGQAMVGVFVWIAAWVVLAIVGVDRAAAAPRGHLLLSNGLVALGFSLFWVLSRRAYGRRVESAAGERLRVMREVHDAEHTASLHRVASHFAHELGTPLNVVAGYADILRDESANPQEVMAAAQIISEQAQQMSQSIRRFLAQTNPTKRERTRTDIVALAHEAVRLLSSGAESQGAVIEVEPANRGMECQLDARQFRQVLVALLKNALAALPGVVSIEITKAQNVMHPELAEPIARATCIAVRDDGAGMTREQLTELFTLQRRSAGGVKLGLSIARGVARDHGGWLTVESEYQRGTCIRIYVPEGDE